MVGNIGVERKRREKKENDGEKKTYLLERSIYVPGEGSTSGWTFREFERDLSLKRKVQGRPALQEYVCAH